MPWQHVIPATLLPLFELACAQTLWEFVMLLVVLCAIAALEVWVLPTQGWLIVHEEPAAAHALGRVSRVWFASVVATVLAGALFRVASAHYDRRIAERVSGAVERYHDERGEYPESLEALVPRYLSEVPRAHLRSGEGCGFRYERWGTTTALGRFAYVADVDCNVNDGDAYDFALRRWNQCSGTRCVAVSLSR